MNINIWVMWDNENDFIDWKNTTSKCDKIATVDNGEYKIEYEYCEGIVYVTELEFDNYESCYGIVDEYIDSVILQCETLEETLIWLLKKII